MCACVVCVWVQCDSNCLQHGYWLHITDINFACIKLLIRRDVCCCRCCCCCCLPVCMYHARAFALSILQVHSYFCEENRIRDRKKKKNIQNVVYKFLHNFSFCVCAAAKFHSIQSFNTHTPTPGLFCPETVQSKSRKMIIANNSQRRREWWMHYCHRRRHRFRHSSSHIFELMAVFIMYWHRTITNRFTTDEWIWIRALPALRIKIWSFRSKEASDACSDSTFSIGFFASVLRSKRSKHIKKFVYWKCRKSHELAFLSIFPFCSDALRRNVPSQIQTKRWRWRRQEEMFECFCAKFYSFFFNRTACTAHTTRRDRYFMPNASHPQTNWEINRVRFEYSSLRLNDTTKVILCSKVQQEFFVRPRALGILSVLISNSIVLRRYRSCPVHCEWLLWRWKTYDVLKACKALWKLRTSISNCQKWIWTIRIDRIAQ